jgi:hypothetical protein
MTKKSISIASAMLITLSLPLAQADVRLPSSITVADLAKETLKQVQASAAAAADGAHQLRMSADSKSSPDSHLARLTVLKGEINRMGQEIGSLEAERDLMTPWDQQAVDKVLLLVQATAANTDCAIRRYGWRHGFGRIPNDGCAWPALNPRCRETFCNADLAVRP